MPSDLLLAAHPETIGPVGTRFAIEWSVFDAHSQSSRYPTEGAIMISPEEMQCVGFLRDLSEPYLSQIGAMARLQVSSKGTVLFHEGEASPFIWFILSGEVRLDIEYVDGEKVVIYTAGPGEMLGWSPVLGRPVMTATARVASRCRVAVLEVSQVLALCEQDPRFGMAFLKQLGVFLSERLDGTRRCLAFARALSHLSPFALAHEGSD
jgi:CRP-like cAMP-binding protein